MGKKYTSVYQRPPLPVPKDLDEIRRTIQVLEYILDDIYRRFGRLDARDLSATVNAAIETAQTEAATARAVQETGTVPEGVTQEQINAWANEALAEGLRQGLNGAALSAYINAYIKRKISEA